MAVFSAPTEAAAIFEGENWVLYSVINSITFSAGIYIVLAGVRMLINEIVPAFKGISEKLVPNAKPALDCPIVFPFAPNAVLIGFLCSFIGGIVATFLAAGLYPILGTMGFANTTFSDTDFTLVGIVFGNLIKVISGNGLMVLVIALFVIPIVYNYTLGREK